MEIRATKKDFKLFRKIGIPDNTTLTEDAGLKESLIMVHDKAKLVPWTYGRKNIVSYLRLGYVAIRKKCPYRHRKCIGCDCSLYVIKNGTGDCSHVWQAVLAKAR